MAMWPLCSQQVGARAAAAVEGVEHAARAVQRGRTTSPLSWPAAALETPHPHLLAPDPRHHAAECPTGAELAAALPDAFLMEPKGATGGMHIDQLSATAEMDGLQLGTISIENQRVSC